MSALIRAAICNWYVCARVCMCARGWGYQIIKDLHFAGNTEHKEEVGRVSKPEITPGPQQTGGNQCAATYAQRNN